MKIVNISGGLGNQMFQYAFALSLKYKNPQDKVLIDIQHYKSIFFKHYKGINLHNGYEINKIFHEANLPVAGPLDLLLVSWWIPNYVLSRIVRKYFPQRRTEYIEPFDNIFSYDHAVDDRDRSTYYEGYWQCPKYFESIREEIKKKFTPQKPNEYNSSLMRTIINSNSIGIHVRRGDYLKEPEYAGICDFDYYQKAIKAIVKTGINYHFYFFSNDIEWCKDNLFPLIGDNHATFVTENTGRNSYWDMFLMSKCKNLIIANSTFSWWGAYLGDEDRIIVAPRPWSRRSCKMDLYDKNWVLIDTSASLK